MSKQMNHYHRQGLFGITIVASIITFLLSSSGFADENRLPEAINDPMGIRADLTNIEIEFCNDDNISTSEGHFVAEISDSSPYDLCIKFYNQNDVDVTFDMGFVDGAYTVDTTQKRSCKSNEFTERFGQYITGYEPQTTVAANSVVQKNVLVNFPKDYVGSVRGCMVFSLNPGYNKDTEGLFDVVVRKAHFIDFFIDGPVNSEFFLGQPSGISMLDNLSNNKMLYANRTPEGNLDFVIGLENGGDIDQDLQVQLQIKNFLGKTINNISVEKKIMAHQKNNIRFSQISLPWYRGYFFVDIELYETSNQENISKASVSTSIFLFPARVIVLLISLFILFHLFGWISNLNKKETKVSNTKQSKKKSQSSTKKSNIKKTSTTKTSS